MAIFDVDRSELDRIRAPFEHWLRQRPGMAGANITAFGNASEANGYSNETYIIRVQSGSDSEQLILRLPPSKQGLFPRYDLPRQYRFMHGLEGVSGLAMGRCRWLEADPSVLGRPFYVVDCVHGQVAADEPHYLLEGWLAEASDAERAAVWHSTLDQLAALSQVRWSGEKLAQVDWPNKSRPRLQQHLQWFQDLSAWGRGQLPVTDHPVTDNLLSWLQQNMPASEEAGIVWGDARFGNVIYRDCKPAALLDWELACIGDPEIDLAYLLFMQFLGEIHCGPPGRPVARPGGFSSDEDAVNHYTRVTGREPRHYHYYWLFNAYRMIAIWECLAPLMVRMGRLQVDEALAMRSIPMLAPYLNNILDSDSKSTFMV